MILFIGNFRGIEGIEADTNYVDICYLVMVK